MNKMTDKVRDLFGHDNLQVNLGKRRIEVYYMHDAQGKDWVPYGGGPLYGDMARYSAAWLCRHVAEYRDLLPKACRDYEIVYGVLYTRTFPGEFYVCPMPAEKASA